VNAAKKYPNTCQECHGSDLTGGIAQVSCFSCHVNGSPFTATDCTSCHSTPPNGTTSPNRAGAHSVHNALQNVTGVCDTCHSGAGTGTSSHFNGIDDVNILSTYSAQSGTAGINADDTCSNVSCHGGLTTPVWSTGTIDVNTDCVSCHSFGTGEYNGYYSGEHSFHVSGQGIACTSCHDTSQLAQTHFTTLNTKTLEGSAAATLNSSLNYSGGGCDPSCHGPQTW
jgi:predicted CxxxxCH...CXXCH cytochrome family protein